MTAIKQRENFKGHKHRKALLCEAKKKTAREVKENKL
jgi:hypothetical protein